MGGQRSVRDRDSEAQLKDEKELAKQGQQDQRMQERALS